ncbi:RagB/SusD family nutrient uptake outer membrane protein [Dyadobacter sp. CY351]|uniref:RagB/SusD family nutrient uptake outer membrane protein n=1 Tax=Dyadobacter sp. CY351 TaxID=2909337 RepID=UPI001F16ACD7|nr:RagB/SusD family nutrient uptake outer membrane protein [Dyadobacter sp. CY351]MCF2517086.1 RagB/SusD family nutrient uptake outer membrane protein [Dyadobacter sp. CY351]
MITKKIIYALTLLMVLFTGCDDALVEPAQGVISGDDLNTPENVDKMVVAAYSALGNDHYTSPFSSMWAYGSIRGGDMYKGGDGPGDLSEFHLFETFSLNRVDNALIDQVWFRLYVGISRTNDAMRRVSAFSEAEYPEKAARMGELNFLRGHFYFLLKILFKYVPYIDETIAKTDYPTISNDKLSNDELWSKIEADFRSAVDKLPENQSDKGRANKISAKAYLAKTLLYKAYEQNETNAVVSINKALLTEVNSLCDEVINSGKYNLSADYADNFLTATENGPESVFAIQYSKNDGTPLGRLDYGHALNYTMNQEYGCCGFHVPSHDLINSFKTSADGLPLFQTYAANDVAASLDFQTSSFDPRLDHTVARPNAPFKYGKSYVFQKSWARAPAVYGAFASIKEVVLPTDPSFQKVPPFMSSAKNWQIIRFADVLLWKAEALIELGRQDEALPLINRIRARAATSTGLLVAADGKLTANFRVKPYVKSSDWTQNYARTAMRWERRLEFAGEGYHFFDLVRWGVAAENINAYFEIEKTRATHLGDAKFTAGRDEYLPIPLNQINFSSGLYKQNAGW